MYDLIILGGGPAGYLACERAGKEGLSTLLIEKENIGGVCLNHGCIPTKTLLYSAKIKDCAKYADKYGVIAQPMEIDHAAVLKRKDKIVRKLTAGIKSQLSVAGTDVVMAEGVIRGERGHGFEVMAGDDIYIGKKLLIATGSSSAIPPIEGIKEALLEGFVLTSREMLQLAQVPEKLVVIGGGVIGLEMASYYNSAGSDVTIIEMLPTIGGAAEHDVAEALKKEYEKKGVEFLLSCSVKKIGESFVVYEQNGTEFDISADKVLLAVGRRPNSEGIGIETLDIKTERGGIVVDEKCRTNVNNVYCAGDVTGKSMLAHVAYRQAEVAVNDMLGIDDNMSYAAIPAVIYTNPEVAGVGHTALSAAEAGLDITEKTLSMNYAGRYMAENERGEGIIKIVVNNKTNTLAGVHMIGNYSSEIIVSAGIMIEKQMKIDEIKSFVFPHPTVSEIIREAVFRL